MELLWSEATADFVAPWSLDRRADCCSARCCKLELLDCGSRMHAAAAKAGEGTKKGIDPPIRTNWLLCCGGVDNSASTAGEMNRSWP